MPLQADHEMLLRTILKHADMTLIY